MNGPDQGCTSREPKHISLDNAINRLRDVRGRAQDLLYKIQGDIPRDVPSNDKEPSLTRSVIDSSPSLQELIDGGPDRINQFYDEINGDLQRIEEALF